MGAMISGFLFKRLPSQSASPSQQAPRHPLEQTSASGHAIAASIMNARQKLKELCDKRKLTCGVVAEPMPMPQSPEGTKKGWVCRTTLGLAPEPMTFEATGPNKKLSTEAAAEKALEYMLSHPAGAGPSAATAGGPGGGGAEGTGTMALTEAVAKALRASGKEPAFHAFHQQSKEQWGGWMPLSLLLQHTKSVRRAAQELGLREGTSHVTQVLALAVRLAQEKQLEDLQPPTGPTPPMPTAATQEAEGTQAPAQPPPPLRLELHGCAVRLSPPSDPPPEGHTLHEALGADGVPGHTLPPSVTAVLLRAPSATATLPPTQELQLYAGQHLLGQITQALLQARGLTRNPANNPSCGGASGAPPEGCGEVVSYEATGIKWPRVQWGRVPSSGVTSPSGVASPSGIASPSGVASPGAASTGVTTPGKAGSTAATSQVALESVEPPFMYGLVLHQPAGAGAGAGQGGGVGAQEEEVQEGRFNPLASWVAGHAVYGDVLLTASRPRNKTEDRKPVMRWASFTPTDLLLAAAALTPTLRLSAMRGAPLLSRLPTRYTTAPAWQGLSPKQLLSAYCERQLSWQLGGAAATPVYQRATPEELGGGDATVEPTQPVEPLGKDQMEVDTKQDQEEEEGEEEQEKGDWEAGEGNAPVGAVSLDLPRAALTTTTTIITRTTPDGGSSGTNTTLMGPWRVQEPVARASHAEWDASEQRAALRMLHLLHAADTAAMHALLRPAGVTAAAAAPAGEEEVEMGAPGAVGEPVVDSLGDVNRGMVKEGQMPNVTYQLWVYPTGVAPPEVSPAVTVPAKRGREEAAGEGEEEEEGGVPRGEGGSGMEGVVVAGGGDRAGGGVAGGGGPVLAEAGNRFLFQVGCGVVVPEMEAAARLLHIGGHAHCRLSVPAAGPDPFGLLPHTWASLRLKLVGIAKPALAPQTRIAALFPVPLGAQRHQLALSLCGEHHATTLCDLGCGDCTLLATLCNTPAWKGRLTRYTGIDVSKGGLMRGGKRICKLLGLDTTWAGKPTPTTTAAAAAMALLEGTPAAGAGGGSSDELAAAEGAAGAAAAEGLAGATRVFQLDGSSGGVEVPACELVACSAFQAGLSEPAAWGDLHGVDVTVLMEVVEHLDPAPLANLGPCLLGGLRPRVLLVTTPNWDCNSIMRAGYARLMEETGEARRGPGLGRRGVTACP